MPNFIPVTYDTKFSLNNLEQNLFLYTFVPNFISITDSENQLNSISEDYGLSLGTLYPPTHSTLVIIERKGF